MPFLRDPPAHLDVFRALGHPARRAIVERLVESEALSEELVDLLWDRFHLMPSSTSKHLSVLGVAGIVVSWSESSHRRYRLRPGALTTLFRWSEAVSEGIDEQRSA